MRSPRLLLTALLACAPALGLALAARAPQDQARATAQPAAAVVAVESIGITVADLERSLAFYTQVLGFHRDSPILEHSGLEHERLEGVFGASMRSVRLRLGEETIELVEWVAPRGRPMPEGSRSNDRWFQHVAIVVSDLGEAYRVLRAHRVRHASSGPQRLPDWNPKAGGIEAFYFLDPDEHVLEVIAFPPGKGDARWHRRDGGLFLGIDHTAIVVADTERSLVLYRDLLGLSVVGESENWGSEQEHLNNVFGARLRITTLRAGAGPGVELLEYLSPPGGRAYPPDARANDLLHWETRVLTDELDGLLERMECSGVQLVSPGPARIAADARALLVRDADGHAIEIHERPRAWRE